MSFNFYKALEVVWFLIHGQALTFINFSENSHHRETEIHLQCSQRHPQELTCLPCQRYTWLHIDSSINFKLKKISPAAATSVVRTCCYASGCIWAIITRGLCLFLSARERETSIRVCETRIFQCGVSKLDFNLNQTCWDIKIRLGKILLQI